jgi:SAM-dependent methyltransferase
VTRAERDKWDDRYRSGSYEGRTHPTALLAEWAPRLPAGKALDVGCGAGRNALYLAAAGFAVDAVDISSVALERARRSADERGLAVQWLAVDLDEDADVSLPNGPYGAIVWVRYVNRQLMPSLLRRLRAGGYLLCEQHLTTTADVVGPKSPEFRLEPGELRASAVALDVLFYREGLVIDPDGRTAALAQLVARIPD